MIALLIVETHIYFVKGMLQTFFLNLLFTKFYVDCFRLEGELDPPLMTKFFVLTCQIDAEQALPLVQANTNIILDPAIQVTISADNQLENQK